MNRPTIADLTRTAGVSSSTVNRLLHGTGKVRAETAERIVEAAQKIGFYGLGALRERKRTNLPQRHFGFLMQQSHRPLYQTWAKAIIAAADRRADAIVEPDVRFVDDLSPESVAANLLKLGETADAVAVIAADHPLVSQAIDQLRMKDVRVVAYVTDLSAAGRAGFVGTDNWKAGRTAAWFISQTACRPGKVFPFIGSPRYQCQDISDASFRSYLRELSRGFQVAETLLTREDPEHAYELVRQLTSEEPDIVGIFVNGGGVSGVVRAVCELPPERRSEIRIVSRDIGPETRNRLSEGLITAALCHSEKMPDALIDVMLHLVERKVTASIEQRLIPFEIVTPESTWT